MPAYKEVPVTLAQQTASQDRFVLCANTLARSGAGRPHNWAEMTMNWRTTLALPEKEDPL